MGPWRMTTEPQKPGNFPGPGPEVVEREFPKSERCRVRSWTVQNEIRGVLGRVSTGAAGRILDSANPRDKSLTVVCVRCSEEREQSERDEVAQAPHWRSREPVRRRISMRQYASSQRRVDTRNETRETARDS